MNQTDFKRFLVQQLEQIEPTIRRPASSEHAELVAECKRIAYSLGLHELAFRLPDNEHVKTPLACCNSLRLCLNALEQPDESGCWDVKQAAKKMGVSPETVYKLCQEHALDHRRIGKRIVITPAAVQDFLASA